MQFVAVTTMSPQRLRTRRKPKDKSSVSFGKGCAARAALVTHVNPGLGEREREWVIGFRAIEGGGILRVAGRDFASTLNIGTVIVYNCTE